MENTQRRAPPPLTVGNEDARLLKGMMLSAISQELRTPLNGIIGLSDSLLNNPTLDPKFQKTVKLIKSSGHRLATLGELNHSGVR